MKKKRFLPWMLATASALVAAGVMAQPAETSRFERWSTDADCMTTPRPLANTSRQTLRLSDAQEALWMQAHADSQAVRQAMRDNFERMHAAVTVELARATPDFMTVADIESATSKANQVLRDRLQDIWLQVYVVLSDEQQAMVHQAMMNAVSYDKHLHGMFDFDSLHMMANEDARRVSRRNAATVALVTS